MLKEVAPRFFGGIQTRNTATELAKLLVTRGMSSTDAKKLATEASRQLGKLNPKNTHNKTPLYFSGSQLDFLADELIKDPSIVVNEKVEATLKNAPPTMDSADISFYGRFVASAPSLIVESASSVAPAFSVNEVSQNELDFFTAVEERPLVGSKGSAYMDYREYNSATYYQYLVFDLNLLADKEHLAHYSLADRREALATVLKSHLVAMPKGMIHTYAHNNAAYYALGVIRNGQGFSFSDAFESPIRSKNGYRQLAADVITKYWREFYRKYDVTTQKEFVFAMNVNVGDTILSINEFCANLAINAW
jgi:hypothetical protein